MGENGIHTESHPRELAIPDAFARAQALLLDYVLLIIPCMFEWLIIRSWLDNMNYFGIPLMQRTFEPQMAIGPLGVVFPLFLTINLMVLETITCGRTPGKKLSGLRVVSRGGGRISPRQAVLRNLLRLVDMLPAYYLVGLAWMASDKLRRRVGDVVAGTVVIVEREHVLPFMKEPVKSVAPRRP